MNIAIDFDETITLDPSMWKKVIKIMKDSGHCVYCVTLRNDSIKNVTEVYSVIGNDVDAIFFTGGMAKKDYMYDQGFYISVWIDDNPFLIVNDARGYIHE